MQASLIQSPDEHHLVLLDHRVAQLNFDVQSVRLQTWSLDSSTELRLTAPFTLRQPAGAVRSFDPLETATLGPVLALLRRRMASLTFSADGELTAEFDGGLSLHARPSARGEAWEVQGGGTLEGLAYRG